FLATSFTNLRKRRKNKWQTQQLGKLEIRQRLHNILKGRWRGRLRNRRRSCLRTYFSGRRSELWACRLSLNSLALRIRAASSASGSRRSYCSASTTSWLRWPVQIG